MSYCRFSSEDFQCDVYAYEHVHGGFAVHVASIKRIFKKPLPPPAAFNDPVAWLDRHEKVLAMVDAADKVEIGLSHDGKNLVFAEPGEAADFLVALKAEGYCVPNYAIEALREEQQEMDA